MRIGQILPVVIIGLPALALVLWPLLRRRGDALAERAAPAPDGRLELVEEKTSVYRALRELAFDHEAGHLSDSDYEDMRVRYEARAAEVLRALDALGPVKAPAAVPERSPVQAVAGRRGWTRSPVAITVGACIVLVFGVVIGLGVARFAQVDQTAMAPGGRMAGPGSPGMDLGMGGGPEGMAPPAGAGNGRALSPEILAGMLQAARQSLFDGQYQPAIAAYRAILKRDANNVDAMTHLALIVAIGGHADSALETWDKALRIDPNYAPAYLYRGQVLYEVKQDYAGAVKAWERYVALVPQGEDHDRVTTLLEEARAKQRAR